MGTLCTFYGYGLFYLTIAIAAFVFAFAVAFGAICGASGSAIAAICAGLVAGTFATVVLVRHEKLGAALCGACGGVAAYMFLNGVLLTHLYDLLPATHQSYTPALVAAVLGLLGAALVQHNPAFCAISA